MRIFPLVLCGSIALAATTHAATVVLAGSIAGVAGANNDEVDQWRSTDVVKSLDPNGDNVYGTAGYVLYATDAIGNGNTGAVAVGDPLTYNLGNGRQTYSSIPTFLTLTNNGQNQTASSYGYKPMDNPSLAIGTGVADVESGAALRSAALGTEVSMLDITVGSNFPAGGLRIGIFVGNTDFYQGTIRLTQTTGGAGTATATQAVLTDLQLYFFDLKNAAAGDVFTLYLEKDNPVVGGGNANTNVLYGGLTFDPLPVPEPAAGLSLCLGASLFAIRRNRRRTV